MSQNGQTHFNILAAFAARLLKCVCSFWDIVHWRLTRFSATIATCCRHFVPGTCILLTPPYYSLEYFLGMFMQSFDVH